MLTLAVARSHVASFAGKHVVVVGDAMLDEYVRGEVTRVSPEAPVPVVELRDRVLSGGGAANAAANVVSLGGRATLLAAIGSDAPGDSLRRCLRERGVVVDGAPSTHERPTTHKMRIVARTQQIARIDVESREPLPTSAEDDLVRAAEGLGAGADAFLVSDYAKGVVSDRVARAILAVARKGNLPVVVDPKGRSFDKYAGATVITPNIHELEVAAGKAIGNVDEEIVEAGRSLLPALLGTALLVTRGASGMTLLAAGYEPLHLPTVARSVFDVTGAGDTVVGTLTLALASRVPLREALTLASHAAGIAVGRAGTVHVGSEELVASFDP